MTAPLGHFIGKNFFPETYGTHLKVFLSLKHVDRFLSIASLALAILGTLSILHMPLGADIALFSTAALFAFPDIAKLILRVFRKE